MQYNKVFWITSTLALLSVLLAAYIGNPLRSIHKYMLGFAIINLVIAGYAYYKPMEPMRRILYILVLMLSFLYVLSRGKGM